jgi:hypothetical protein
VDIHLLMVHAKPALHNARHVEILELDFAMMVVVMKAL